MGNPDRDSIDLRDGAVGRTLAKILLPTLAGMCFSMVFILTDGIFVGHGIGSDALAAVNIVMPAFTLATALGLMTATGASVTASIHLSHGNVKAARIVATQAFICVILVGAALGAALYAMPTPILRLMGADSRLMPVCRPYYFWFIPCMLCLMVQFVGQFIIRLDGSPTYAGLVEIIPACVNIFLDWLFIFPMDLGLAGAAAATSIGGAVAVGMVWWYMRRRCRTLRLYRLKTTATSFRLSLRNIGYMFRTGSAAFLGEFSQSVLTVAGNRTFMRHLGGDGVAALSVTWYMLPIIYMVFAAISQSAQPLISFSHGIGDRARMHRTLRLSLILAVAFSVIMSAAFMLFPSQLVSVFIDRSAPAHGICVAGLPLYALGFPFMAVMMTVIGYLQSIEMSVQATVLTALRGMALPTAAFAILPGIMGTEGLWLSVPTAEALTMALFVIPYYSVKTVKAVGRTHRNIE